MDPLTLRARVTMNNNNTHNQCNNNSNSISNGIYINSGSSSSSSCSTSLNSYTVGNNSARGDSGGGFEQQDNNDSNNDISITHNNNNNIISISYSSPSPSTSSIRSGKYYEIKQSPAISEVVSTPGDSDYFGNSLSIEHQPLLRVFPEEVNSNRPHILKILTYPRILKSLAFLLFLSLVIGLAVKFKIQLVLIPALQYVQHNKILGFFIIILSLILMVLLCLPGFGVIFMASGLIFKPLPLALAINMLGINLGACITFFLGRYAFKEFVSKKVERRKRLVLVRKAVEQEGDIMMGLLRVAIPYSLGGYLFAASTTISVCKSYFCFCRISVRFYILIRLKDFFFIYKSLTLKFRFLHSVLLFFELIICLVSFLCMYHLHRCHYSSSNVNLAGHIVDRCCRIIFES